MRITNLLPFFAIAQAKQIMVFANVSVKKKAMPHGTAPPVENLYNTLRLKTYPLPADANACVDGTWALYL